MLLAVILTSKYNMKKIGSCLDTGKRLYTCDARQLGKLLELQSRYLRWLERVFKCNKPSETRKDYMVFLNMWAVYEYLDNSFVGQ